MSVCSPAYGATAQANVFRLGTAALPYGWSTAIADFDADKKPDFAIANKIGTSSRGYEYSVELELSLEARQVFRFHSPDSALSITALDLDNDQDLDVVLTRTFNGEVVGVWLNNGYGHFSEDRNPHEFTPVISVSGSVRGDSTSSVVLIGNQLRKVVPMPTEKELSWATVNDRGKRFASLIQQSHSVNRRATIIPRAPPAFPLLSTL